MKAEDVAAVVVTHGAVPELDVCLAALVPQVGELVVVANPPAPASLPVGVTLLENDRPLGFAANANRGLDATTTPFVVVANPDTRATPNAVRTLRDFAASRSRSGVVGPRLLNPDGTLQSSRRRFPTVSGTLVRRTPMRWLLRPQERQRAHYMMDEQPSEPVQADWLLGAFLILRRDLVDELGGFDPGFRLYGEDIDLCYRASKAGWERWYVPDAVVFHQHEAVTDRRFMTRRTLWHWRGIARFVRKHPERLRSL
jgi:N-acetylglucosaminyl-diphospho-decaprenol L-rhamnosyltransferase